MSTRGQNMTVADKSECYGGVRGRDMWLLGRKNERRNKRSREEANKIGRRWRQRDVRQLTEKN